MASIDVVGPNGKRLPAGSTAPRGAKYRARWRSPDGKSRMATFDRKADAQAHLDKLAMAKREGTYIDNGAARTTFEEYARRWAAAQPYRATTAQNTKTILDVHLIPRFGARRLRDIKPTDIQAWVTELSLTYKPATIRSYYGRLKVIFNAAVDDQLITRSPCTRRVKRPKDQATDSSPMTSAQVAAVAAAMPPRLRAWVALLAGTGMRPGEGLGLCVDRIDFERRTIKIDRSQFTLNGQAPDLGLPKTATSIRTIPVPRSVLDALNAHLAAYPATEAGQVFTDERGRWTKGRISWAWQVACERGGVPAGEFTPHSLRHYAASVMIASGANVKQVQKYLGHASSKVTLDTYAHLWPDSLDAPVAALEAGLTGVLATDAAVTELKRGNPRRAKVAA